jgi:hypothetical protein
MSSWAVPHVHLGSTLVTGSHLPLLQQDLFAGSNTSYIYALSSLTCDAGIPFAEAPVGKLRLQPPVLKIQLGVRQFNATHFGFACLQPVRPLSDVNNQFPMFRKGTVHRTHVRGLLNYKCFTTLGYFIKFQTARCKCVQLPL